MLFYTARIGNKQQKHARQNFADVLQNRAFRVSWI